MAFLRRSASCPCPRGTRRTASASIGSRRVQHTWGVEPHSLDFDDGGRRPCGLCEIVRRSFQVARVERQAGFQGAFDVPTFLRPGGLTMYDPIGGFERMVEQFLVYMDTAYRIGDEAVSKARR